MIGNKTKMKISSNSGFTLIELLISTFIFSVIVLVIVAIFINGLNLQRRALLVQELQENLNFVTESIAREIRVAKIECPGSCSGPVNSLTMTHPVNGALTYDLDNGRIVKRIAGQPDVFVTSNTVSIVKLDFYIQNLGKDSRQPRVTIVLAGADAKGSQSVILNTQTTLSQRYLTDRN